LFTQTLRRIFVNYYFVVINHKKLLAQCTHGTLDTLFKADNKEPNLPFRGGGVALVLRGRRRRSEATPKGWARI